MEERRKKKSRGVLAWKILAKFVHHGAHAKVGQGFFIVRVLGIVELGQEGHVKAVGLPTIGAAVEVITGRQDNAQGFAKQLALAQRFYCLEEKKKKEKKNQKTMYKVTKARMVACATDVMQRKVCGAAHYYTSNVTRMGFCRSARISSNCNLNAQQSRRVLSCGNREHAMVHCSGFSISASG